MTRQPETIAFWRGRLPHWEVADGRYFVTIHLAGAIPSLGQKRIHAIASELQRVRKRDDDGRLAIQRRVFAEMETWLDGVAYVDHLSIPGVAQMVVDAIAFREDRDWRMFEFVVMPSHLHLFFELVGTSSFGNESRLKSVVEQFKRWTGHEAAKQISLNGGDFWQDEWFDHWSRSDDEDDKISTYIRRNPETARLVHDYRDWPYGSWK